MKQALFVGGLDFSVTSEELSELFAQFGTVVSAKVITDMYSGRSRGFAFVDMSTGEEAADAVLRLNNSMHKNRTITVREKEDKPRSSNSGGFRGGNGGQRRTSSDRY